MSCEAKACLAICCSGRARPQTLSISFLFSLAFEPRHIEILLLKLQRIIKDGREHLGYHKSMILPRQELKGQSPKDFDNDQMLKRMLGLRCVVSTRFTL